MKIISALLIAFMLISCDKGDGEIIVLPPNYTGYILIVYDQKDGADPVYEGGKRVYNIPKNGILKTKFAANPGWIGIPEFYYAKITPDGKIPFRPNPKILPADSVVAYGSTAGSVKKTAKEKDVIRFLEYYVGNKSQIYSAREQVQKLDIIKLIQ